MKTQDVVVYHGNSQRPKSLFDTVKLVNDRLADNVVGRMDITLTREEYDMLMESVRLPNRFLKLEMIEVE
jgi:hypothetical protein